MMPKKEFLKIVTMVSDLFGKSLSNNALELYYELLKDYNHEQISKAFKKVCSTHKYETFPKPAEIIEAIDGTSEDRAMTAWEQVKEAISKADYYYSVEFKNPIIAYCIAQLGGWQWLCEQGTDEMKFISKDFTRMYSIIEKRDFLPENKRLVGYFEANNMARYPDEKPKIIKIGFSKEELLSVSVDEKPKEIIIQPETPESIKAREEFFRLSKNLADKKD